MSQSQRYDPVPAVAGSSHNDQYHIPPPSHHRPNPQKATMFTSELYLHAIGSFTCILLMLRCMFAFSSSTRPEFVQYSFLLSPSPFSASLFVDNSDSQYSSFRSNLKILIPLLIFHVSVSNAIQYAFSRSSKPFTLWKKYSPRLLFNLAFSVIFFVIYNGLSGFLKLLIVFGFNYFGCMQLMKNSRTKLLVPILSWGFGLAVLVYTNYYRGFQFAWIHPSLGLLDASKGINASWFDPLRFGFLRMISFNMDYYWSQTQTPDSNRRLKEHNESCKDCKPPPHQIQCQKSRVETPLYGLNDYTFTAYLTYLLYIPLYLAGPIISFNDFSSQLKTRVQATYPFKKLIPYLVRWVSTTILMELFIHTSYVIAIAKSGVWKTSFTPFEVSTLGYFNLKHIWLKLLVIWRFFRLWGLLEGIETVENMNRCMTNNYSTSGFWRSWHRSFNRWIIRYIYVPMGGGKNYLLNLGVTFTFVALWHDLNLNLLVWGWLICLSIIPETLAMKLYPHKKMESWPYYKHMCGLGATANIFLMIAVNIIGFGAAGGHKPSADGGIMQMLPLVFNINNLTLFIGIFIFFFCSSQLMFAYREWEAKKGISTRD
ncbi:MBOAT-domain-containing protein [Rhizoclosmatium globosum]|uniref:MBOAT-domain-containing protein n=1 Tax=Rhizoclosmatium globosum TaxID=329046 RepID=A0A1Y2C8T4_9FUNG|nr:MBOAT-domain-containing protein [Rhizoclosmatium globosum]|eukprot:ORY43439.1 MBOAT-domain-containing protein [Rhizoclosmatium globosum]